MEALALSWCVEVLQPQDHNATAWKTALLNSVGWNLSGAVQSSAAQALAKKVALATADESVSAQVCRRPMYWSDDAVGVLDATSHSGCGSWQSGVL